MQFIWAFLDITLIKLNFLCEKIIVDSRKEMFVIGS